MSYTGDWKVIQRQLAARGIEISPEEAMQLAAAQGDKGKITQTLQASSKKGQGGTALLGQRPDDESRGAPQSSGMPEEQAPASATAEAPQTARTEAPGTWETAMMSVAKVAPSIITAANQRRPNAPAFSGGGNRTLDIPTAASVYGKRKEDPFLAKLAMMLRGGR